MATYRTPVENPTPAPSARVVPFEASNRIGPRERDFGIGYGKSSGYASPRRAYTRAAAPSYFRVA